jgi:hypothetical protein
MKKAKSFIPTVGERYSYRYAPEDRYYEVEILSIDKRRATAEVYYCGFDKEDEDYRMAVKFSELEPPFQPSVKKRFSMYDTLCKSALTGKTKSLLITGQPGLGKSHTVEQNLIGLEEGKDYMVVKAKCTPLALYKTLFEMQFGTVIFDDCDSILEHSTSGNILKAALDTKPVRQISWLSSSKALDDVPQTFQFHGQVIFISNKLIEELDTAVLSRSVKVDLYMTPKEIVDHMIELRDAMRGDLSAKKAQEVLDLIWKFKGTITNLNLRTAKLGYDTYLQTGDLEIVRYQLLCTVKN